MQTKVFILAIPLSNDASRGTLGYCVRKSKDLLGQALAERVRVPRFPHITLLPPFRATIAEAKLFSAGLITGLACYGQGRAIRAEPTCEHVFKNGDVNALVIRLSMTEAFVRHVEEMRARVREYIDWVYPIESYPFNPHVALGEWHKETKWETLRSELSSNFGWESVMDEMLRLPSEDLPNPAVYQKDGKDWVPVLF